MRYIKLFIVLSLIIFIQGGTFRVEASKNAVWHNTKGIQYLKEGYYYAAIEEFKTAILLSPNSAATASFYNNLGKTYMELSQFDWAVSCFQKSIDLNPNFIEYYQNLVKGYRVKKILSQSASKYRKITNSDVEDAQAWLTLGLIYRELGQNQEAISCFEEFKRLEPDLAMTKGVVKIINTIKTQ